MQAGKRQFMWRALGLVGIITVPVASGCSTSKRRNLAASVVATTSSSAPTLPATTGTRPTGAPSTATRTTRATTTTTTSTATTTTTTKITTTTVASGPSPAVMPVAGPGLAVGDSVLEDVQLFAPATLASHGITIDAKVSRSWAVGVAILMAQRSAHRLPDVVIVVLGTNGPIDAAMFDQMMAAADGATRVVFMTVDGPFAANNPVIRAGVARYTPQASLADWAALSATHPEWFGRDPQHVHVGGAGATALGNLLLSVA